MSSTPLTSDELSLIERMLAKVRVGSPQPCSQFETAEVRLLIRALEDGIYRPSELRDPLCEQAASRADASSKHSSDDDGPLHRQEHMLPSPEEEFDVAPTIHPIGFAPHCSRYIIGKNAAGETALVYWRQTGSASQGDWVRQDTGEPFEAVDWVRTIWTELEVLEHSTLR